MQGNSGEGVFAPTPPFLFLMADKIIIHGLAFIMCHKQLDTFK